MGVITANINYKRCTPSQQLEMQNIPACIYIYIYIYMIDTSDTGISCQQKYQILFLLGRGTCLWVWVTKILKMIRKKKMSENQIGFSSLRKEPEEVEFFVKKLKVESSALIDICVNQDISTTGDWIKSFCSDSFQRREVNLLWHCIQKNAVPLCSAGLSWRSSTYLKRHKMIHETCFPPKPEALALIKPPPKKKNITKKKTIHQSIIAIPFSSQIPTKSIAPVHVQRS